MQKILALLLLFLVSLTGCDETSPSGNVGNAINATRSSPEYELVLPAEIVVEEYGEDLRAWLTSLYRGLGYDQGHAAEEVFMRCNMKVQSSTGDLTVYQSSTRPKRFYVADLGCVIDFEFEEIGTLGVAGISSHSPPSKRMVVLLCPTKGEGFMGVLRGSPKTDSPKPKFVENKVSF